MASAPEFNKRMRQVFDEALNRPEAERPEYVQAACAGDTTLVQAVERLLRAYNASDSFLEGNTGRIERVGRYLIKGELGRGAMGVVYDAVDPMIGRSVAVKVINLRSVTEPSQAEFLRDRLFKEAKSAGQLFHPGIIIILDVGQEGDSAYFTMERVDGPSLQQVLASGDKIETRDALDILRQTAAALDFAHQHGIVHRDVKPANILLQKNGVVKVADFGIAKVMSTPNQTVTGLVMGTPSYMSPEQIESRSVDGRSDQFSLAVMAYELLTGTKPFEAESMATLAHLIAYGDRPSARVTNPELPASVDEVLRRGLARVPAERFGSCVELVSALETAFLHAPPVGEVATANVPARVAAAPQTPVPPVPTPVPVPAAPQVPQSKPAKGGFPFVAVILIVAAALGGAFFLYKDALFPRKQATAAVVRPPVAEASAAAAPLVKTFKADPVSVDAGKSAMLSWEVTGAQEVSIDPEVGKVAGSGTHAVSPKATTSYVLKAAGAGGNVQAEVSVEVKSKAASPAREVYEEAVAKRRAGERKEALTLLRKAADLGEPAAMVDLGERYQSGEGVPEDPAQAVRWFRRAADAGNASGMVFLGAMYLLGEGVPASNEDAARWFQRATDRGNPSAMYDLATLYERGRGVTKDAGVAKQLYERSARLGNSEAKRRLEQLESKR